MPEEAGLVRRAWTKFRSWPLWVQIVTWILVASVIVGPFASEDEKKKDEAASTATTTTAVSTTEARSTTTERVTTTEQRTTTTKATTTTAAPTTTTTSASLGPNAMRVTAADYGEDWPLTVDSGVLSCPVGSAVIFGDEDTAYALNGTALGMADDRGWQDIRESAIWADDGSGLGLKKDIGPLIDDGLDLCG